MLYLLVNFSRNYDKYFVQALKLRRLIYDDYIKMWSTGVDILLTPVTLSDAPLFSEFTEKDSRAQSADQDYCTQPANMAGIPALSLPVRLSKRNLPLSLQLMAPHFDDETLLDVAHLLEKELNFTHPTVKVA
jgi:aspartyl-tRNA(Asn)/glutamyl-tRNA(Gln) amidotransferase subunit A